ncbi:dihydroorotate dehydrogenase B catalytic subunit [Thermogymnomonas acidicola]|uniref:Dihydroorotate dehydrogenase n=1 Tax=Thermogymnomonas acidicola TaxID=399579 RepID=A0AA37BSN6_9ARCH|nr:dihydroorotate dehydrogenase [Thermogymnomonas acidicola]GGM79148.1 dihydroorotate dehydrogenase B catalytic subunit [Thermogymnomonas acidicola]
MFADLSTEVAGLRLENPLMLASGILDENGYSMLRVLRSGASAAVTKSIGEEERNGYRPPVVHPLQSGMLNAIGLANPGIEEYGHEIEIARRAGKPIIGSIFAPDEAGFSRLAERMQSFGVSAIELNLSCPHVKGVGSEVGSDPVLVKRVVQAVKSVSSVPVFAKLSPNVTDLVEIARAASDADGLVLINTVRAMAVDIRARRPVLSNGFGGLSGPSIKPVGIRCVYEVRKAMDIPIVGVGGISGFEDVVEYIMVGSDAVQIGTALWRNGPGIFSSILCELEKFMEEEGYRGIGEMKGVALQ